MRQVHKQSIAALEAVQFLEISYRNQAHAQPKIDPYLRNVKGKLLDSDGGMEFCRLTNDRTTAGVPRYSLTAGAR